MGFSDPLNNIKPNFPNQKPKYSSKSTLPWATITGQNNSYRVVLYQRVAQTDRTTTTIKRQFSRKSLQHLPSLLTLFLGLQNNKPHLYA
jgi:hypothetical protein